MSSGEILHAGSRFDAARSRKGYGKPLLRENLVGLACHHCNNRKGSRTPEEKANMRLARAPRPFSLHTSRHLMRLLGKSDDQWRKYLFY